MARSRRNHYGSARAACLVVRRCGYSLTTAFFACQPTYRFGFHTTRPSAAYPPPASPLPYLPTTFLPLLQSYTYLPACPPTHILHTTPLLQPPHLRHATTYAAMHATFFCFPAHYELPLPFVLQILFSSSAPSVVTFFSYPVDSALAHLPYPAIRLRYITRCLFLTLYLFKGLPSYITNIHTPTRLYLLVPGCAWRYLLLCHSAWTDVACPSFAMVAFCTYDYDCLFAATFFLYMTSPSALKHRAVWSTCTQPPTTSILPFSPHSFYYLTVAPAA